MAAKHYEISPLTDLRPFTYAWRIQVKILHSYKQYSPKTGESIELIVVDESGTKMSVNVKREHVKKFARYLDVGSWKIITNVTVNLVTAMYRVSDLYYRCSFLYNTSVAPSEVVNDSKFLALANYDAILAGTLNNNILVDVIGHVVDCGEAKELITNNKANKKIDFNLRNIENTRVPCTLWGKFADMIDQENQKSEDGMVILLIRFAKLNVYNEIISVQNSFDSSQIFVNSDIPEIVELRRVLSDHGGTLTVGDLGQKRLYVSPKIDPCLQYPRHTISELLAQKEVGKCRTICTIQSVDTDWPWFYISCRNCNKRVIIEDPIKLEDVKIPSQQRFWCELCNNTSSPLSQVDQSGNAKCMLFDSFAKECIGGTTAAQLLNGNFKEIEDPEDLPEVITDICGKTYQFLLCNQRENAIGGYDSYTVAKVWPPHQLHELLMIEESENFLEPNSVVSGDQGYLMITNGETFSDTNLTQSSTPLSKRKSDESCEGSVQSSTSKKTCTTDVVVLDDELSGKGLARKLDDGLEEN